MKRLYHQVYLTIIASLVLVVLRGALWRFVPQPDPCTQAFEMAGELLAALLPPAEGCGVQQQAIERLYDRLEDRSRAVRSGPPPCAAAGNPVPRRRARESGGWLYGRGGPAWAIRLPDDRWIVARHRPAFAPPRPAFWRFWAASPLPWRICAYPLVRGLTRRLERLQAGVELLGAGDLSARVKVEGKDEVARLAQSFNRAAARIEELVARTSCCSPTSHELRTPLSRIRLGVELLKDNADPSAARPREGHCRARSLIERDPAFQPPRAGTGLDAAEPSTFWHSRPRRVPATSSVRCRATRDRTGRSGPPAPHGAQPARQCRATWRAAHRGGGAPGGPAGRAHHRRQAGRDALDQERVFSPFFRVPGAMQGTGLGLDAGAPDCAATWRRGRLGGHAAAAEPNSGGAAVGVRAG